MREGGENSESQKERKALFHYFLSPSSLSLSLILSVPNSSSTWRVSGPQQICKLHVYNC